MNEAQRFLRLVLPGLAFLVEVWLLIAVTDWQRTLERTMAWLQGDALGTAVSLFVVSGGIGFVLATIHHFLHWRLWIPLRLAARPTAVEKAIGAGLLELIDAETRQCMTAYPKPRQQWQVLVSLWHQRKSTSSQIGSATDRVESLSDLVHGVGTGLVGSIFAIVVWMLLAGPIGGPGIGVAAALLLLHTTSFWLVTRQAQGIVDMVLLDALFAEAEAKQQAPVRVFFSAR
jgi:hypothetical protein